MPVRVERAGIMRSHLMLVAAMLACASASAFGQCAPVWPMWQSFVTRFVQQDGRVVNFDMQRQESMSETQAYALFFALVANDPATFQRLLNWTRDNLAAGDLTDKLPAWQWGKRADGSWGVLDANSASDADLWLAYTLLEAGRLWRRKPYAALGRLIATQIARREVAMLRGLGPMLLPGENGFVREGGLVRLNPSYVPVPLLRRLAVEDPEGPWSGIAQTTLAVVQATAATGFAPDWIAWREGQGFLGDPDRGESGSFDAIRVYLWAGLTDPSDPLQRPLLDALAGMQRVLTERNVPPLKVGSASGAIEGTGPVGFSAAVLPYLKARRQPKLVEQQQLRVAALQDGGPGQKGLGYYDSVLTMFGKGWSDQRFRFDREGRLIPRWRQPCESLRKNP